MITTAGWNDATRAALLTDTCTIRVRTKTGTDAKNKAVYTWADETVDTPCRGESLAALTGFEDRRFTVDNQDVLATFRMYLNPNITIDEYRRVVWNGETYHVGFAEEFEDLSATDYMTEVLLANMKDSD